MSDIHADWPAVLADLGRIGVEVAIHPDDPSRLRFRPPNVPAGLRSSLRLHQLAVLALLSHGYVPNPGSEAEYVLGERLGIADGLGMPTHPGSPAWLVAAGESITNSCLMTTHALGSGHGKAA